MPTLRGETLTRREFLARVGRVEQAGGLRRVRLAEGPGAGAEVIEVDTGEFSFELIPSRGLDVGACRYHGKSIAWQSPAGIVAPGLVQHEAGSFERTFGGGLLTTCGLQNVGNAAEEEGIPYWQHGRASETPAEHVAAWGEWAQDDYLFNVRGVTREASLYEAKLQKTRVVRAKLGEARLEVLDVVQNVGSRPVETMFLYHLNFGWPLLSPETRLRLHSKGVMAIQGEAEGWEEIPAPDPDWTPVVLEHEITADADGWARFSLTGAGMKVRVGYDAKTLPRFTQWRQFGAVDYVLGLEPGSTGVRGRTNERAVKALPVLKPGESVTYRLELSVEPA
ncbi:MAG TPA: aldose 1-epimerase family protein [Deinococcales bacterium]|nr:aldose 1-epimerase family protein [Deinococcales bacterium]